MGRSRTTLHFLLKFWPIGRFFNWLGRQPPFGSLLRHWFGPEQNHAVIIPINQDIRGTESLVLPEKLLKPLVERASDRIILSECLCRKAEGCQDYPVEIGCLFLGQGAARIHPSMGRQVSRQEALAHVERGIRAGLTPLIVHAAFDAYMLGIPYRQMLAVCFCCDCCCTIRTGLRMGPPAFWEAVQRLPGLTVRVGEGCLGCGVCVELCHVHAITIVDGVAVIGELCKGCGRCASSCPAEAIEMDIQDLGGMAAFIEDNLRQRTDIGLPARSNG